MTLSNQATKLEPTLAFATLFFSSFFRPCPSSIPFAPGFPDSLSGFLIALNAFNYLAAAYAMLWPTIAGRSLLLVLALSAAHLTVSGLVPPRSKAKYLFAASLRRTRGSRLLTLASLFARR